MSEKERGVLIGGLQKSSLIDYPEKISAIVFTQGCNFRCPYCHNPELISKSASTEILVDALFEFLNSRIGKIDGVVITGGEPTLHKGLLDLIKKIKCLGFAVKLDTNGTNPEMLEYLIKEKLIDYVAMDIKAPFEKYGEVVCSNVNTENVLKSIEILKNSNIDYEFRTTVVKYQLTFEDFEKIGKLIENSSKYYLQKFIPTKTLDESFINEITYSDTEFEKIINILKKYVKTVELR